MTAHEMRHTECLIWRAMGIHHRHKLVEVEFDRDGCTLVLADGYIFIESECNRRFFEYVDWDTEKDLLKAVKAEAETICEEADYYQWRSEGAKAI